MNEFDLILEECVDLIASGETTLEECLILYPEYAAQLEPILYTAVALQEEGQEVAPPPFLRERIRGELNHAMQKKPEKKSRSPVFFWRMALTLSVLVFALGMTNTGMAQGALPGGTLYNWKLAGERVWRAVTGDPIGTDLKLSSRHVGESVTASSDQQRRTEVLLGYNKLLVRFKAEKDESNQDRIQSALKTQQNLLRRLGLSIPELDNYISHGEFQTNPPGMPAAISNP